jgi:alkanesulfonate monooxygenase SsuD/methylene tetrahydromethanopterin reductase-like flavin-dependent oxidoreductase (luciferase family)
VSDFRVSAWLDSAWPIDIMIDAARDAEQLGYGGLWLADHFMSNTGTSEPSEDGVNECFSSLAGLARSVPRVRLGSMVAAMTYRHPAVVAKIASTIDHLSGGRFVLGLGPGWQLNEHESYGIPLGSVRDRVDRFAEGVQVISGLLNLPRTTVTGDYYQLKDATLDPKPVQARLPILLAASGERRTLPIVAAFADEWNCWSTPPIFAQKSAVLDSLCEHLGRSPESIWRTTAAHLRLDDPSFSGSEPESIGGSVSQVVDTVGRWRELGLNEWIVPFWGDPRAAREALGRVMTDVVAQLA